PDYARSNPWEHSARPSNAMGGGGVTPSAMMVDLFPMADGKRPASYNSYTDLDASTLTYDSQHPFMFRDTRFYRTFGFPGIYWAMQGDPMNANNMNPYANGDYQLWNYVWYIDEAKVNDPLSSDTYGADNLLANAKGMYVIKRTSIGDNHRYTFDAGFKRSYQSWMEMRYTEVMLNYAEIACGAGHPEVALAELQKIRFMAGYNDSYNKTMSDGTTLQYENYGLPLGLDGDARKCMQAIIYERQIEFAYEGKRFDDMRRWLLFDGGTGLAAIGAKPLNGWGGNTCTYLGFEPFNGQRRSNMEFQVKPAINKGIGGKEWKEWDNTPDPIAQHWIAEQKAANPDGTYGWTQFRDWRKGFAINYNSNGRHGNSDKLDNLLIKLKTNFYEPYLQRKDKKGDALTSDNTTEGMVVTYLPRYYFLGLTSTVQAKNPLILQTVGWEDHYGRGEFYDPAAE
ncbi:MAG: RagB/SusD family nutrient uptake outer membrane protein, partial [Alistipes sp.]|nr:RagB/SusD family nutrient uptake outer membrane protein [Alistipes sp.]